jgi:thiol:disulfide interchange protein
MTCKTNEAVALNTHETKQLVLKNAVVTLKADKTHRRNSEPVNELLVALGNYGKTIPYVAIYPAGKDEPIKLDGLITRDQLLSALEQAGPSRGHDRGAE